MGAMTADEAIQELKLHLTHCAVLMPIAWAEKHGEGSRFTEAYEMALQALRELKARPPLEEMVELVQKLTWKTYETGCDLSALWCDCANGPCTAGGEFDCRDEWIIGCIRRWLEKPAEERWEQVRKLFGTKQEEKSDAVQYQF